MKRSLHAAVDDTRLPSPLHCGRWVERSTHGRGPCCARPLRIAVGPVVVGLYTL